MITPAEKRQSSAHQQHKVPHRFGPVEEVHDDTVLWRYIPFIQLVALLDSKMLRMARGDTFDDPLEGSLSKPTRELRNRNIENNETLSRCGFEDTSRMWNEEGRKYTAVSCWFAAERESKSMWNDYGKEPCSVALVTTAGALRRRLEHQATKPPMIHRFGIYKVQYIDFETDFMDQSGIPFMFKSNGYTEECEVRVLREAFTPWYGDPNRTSPRPTFPVAGSFVRLNLSFIDRVVLKPGTPSWQLSIVQNLLNRHHVKVDAEKSNLDLAQPVY